MEVIEKRKKKEKKSVYTKWCRSKSMTKAHMNKTRIKNQLANYIRIV